MRQTEPGFMIPHDYHIHTNFSCDSQATMSDMCRAALAMGIPEIAFTDHFDLIPEDPCYAFFQADGWWQEIKRCRQAFRHSLIIRAGVEIGEPHRFRAEVDDLLASHPWDFAIGSLHWTADELIFDPQYYQQPEDRAYRRYFGELLQMVEQSDIDILAHLDIVKRYGFEHYGPFDPQRYQSEIRSILRACASRGIAIEVNTSTLRRSVNEPSPNTTPLRWFAEEGGKWITLGSDAHLPEHVGFGLQKAIRSVCAAGFEVLAAYELRQPRGQPLCVQAQ
ncbi:MAG: histidinol-phosphatase HisJ family protein [Anaerolineales bacterium]|jgi:histidinol-phosphatase (PHP family)